MAVVYASGRVGYPTYTPATMFLGGVRPQHHQAVYSGPGPSIGVHQEPDYCLGSRCARWFEGVCLRCETPSGCRTYVDEQRGVRRTVCADGTTTVDLYRLNEMLDQEGWGRHELHFNPGFLVLSEPDPRLREQCLQYHQEGTEAFDICLRTRGPYTYGSQDDKTAHPWRYPVPKAKKTTGPKLDSIKRPGSFHYDPGNRVAAWLDRVFG